MCYCFGMLSSKISLDQRADDMGEFEFQFLYFLDGAEYKLSSVVTISTVLFYKFNFLKRYIYN